jgi:lipopolysaccharide transport system ATP-binding protein
MSDIAIRVEGLSKKFRIGAPERYRTLRDTMTNALTAPFRFLRNGSSGRAEAETIWALKDVSFDVKQGEVIGIIGRNGAGKSTLLKILSRITQPTEGYAKIHGRVRSLLEVGTGFHPELSGRENIFLNGAILGMKKAEILRKFDEIVAFAEVERFLDTPVKHYSSGMYVRLAFAVAAHLDPEILVIDEVLAVGDAAFQKKCLSKMGNASEKEGRTILFVSHNMQAVGQLCSKAILLTNGHKRLEGENSLVIGEYLKDGLSATSLTELGRTIKDFPPDPVFRLRDIDIVQGGKSGNQVISGEEVEVVVEYDIFQEAAGFHIWLSLYDFDGTLLFESLHNGNAPTIPIVYPGAYISRARFPADFLASRTYDLRINAAIHGVRTCIPQIPPLTIPITVTGLGRVNCAYSGYVTPGKLAPLIPWHTRKVDPSAVGDAVKVGRCNVRV